MMSNESEVGWVRTRQQFAKLNHEILAVPPPWQLLLDSEAETHQEIAVYRRSWRTHPAKPLEFRRS